MNKIKITWQYVDDMGAPVARFVIHYSSSLGNVNTSVSGDTHQFIFGPPSGTVIHFEIKAVTADGIESPISALDFTAP